MSITHYPFQESCKVDLLQSSVSYLASSDGRTKAPFFVKASTSFTMQELLRFLFTGLSIVSGAHHFIVNCKSFFVVIVSPGRFVCNEAYERFLANGIKDRSSIIPTSLCGLGLDHPMNPLIVRLGGNTNGIKSSTGLNPSNLTGGLARLRIFWKATILATHEHTLKKFLTDLSSALQLVNDHLRQC